MRDIRDAVSLILRARGFVPLPRLWVKQEDIPEIYKITKRSKNTVLDVRASVHANDPKIMAELDSIVANPVLDKDAAWEVAEKGRSK